MANRAAAYRASPGSPLDIDRDFYQRIAEATDRRRLVTSLEVPIRDALAWEVPAGHVMRVCTRQGAQVGDFNMWSLQNPRERFWASRTRQLQRSHVSVHDRLIISG